METLLKINGRCLQVVQCQAAVVGCGAAGWAAAWRLNQCGVQQVVVLADSRTAGTSRNAGSDKQTYYRISQAGAAKDSVAAMAQDLFDGGAVDGDLALCEASLSARCFYALTELGVPFPQDEYGGYTGYKTDHDPASRASSVGPYTSRCMTQVLERTAEAVGVTVLNGWQAVRLLKKNGRIVGVLCLNKAGDYCVCGCGALVLATGGPADIWEDRVYPGSQTGASGLAFEAGAAGKNLTEWQFGLASLKPRWNVSGTYMQALPKVFSVDEEGNEIDFLQQSGLYASEEELLSDLFLKGYQWPFDARRAAKGSSRIDLAVYRQQQLGRRVFLDYTREPGGSTPLWGALSPQARTYLEKAGACLPLPIDRLRRMNAPAVEFYASHGVDLSTKPLEIGLCAQHHNGGLAVDVNWQTTLPGLYCVGEAAATHGIRRPGGSALNAGQVGALRAAQAIAKENCPPPDSDSLKTALQALQTQGTRWEKAWLWNESVESTKSVSLSKSSAKLGNSASQKELRFGTDLLPNRQLPQPPLQTLLQTAQHRMSAVAGVLREKKALQDAIEKTDEDLVQLQERFLQEEQLAQGYRLRQILLCQRMVLAAMLNYAQTVGLSRGSALYATQMPDDEASTSFRPEPPRPENARRADENLVQETDWNQGACTCRWRAVRPVPVPEDCFETVWREFRARYPKTDF